MSGHPTQVDNSGDWLKALSVLAFMFGGIPDKYNGSAAIAGFVLVLLATMSQGIFYALYALATGALVWLAVASGKPLFVWYAGMYTLLGVVLLLGDERRRDGKGHFLLCIWWLGQVLLLGLDASHIYKSGGSTSFFANLFLAIGGAMTLKELVGGVRKWLRDRTNSRHVATLTITRLEPPRDRAA